MPIAREHRWLYPIDWRELSDLIRFRRAKGQCEHCRRPHGRDVLHLGDGVWWDEDAAIWRDGRGRRLRYLPAPHELPHVQPGLFGIDPPAVARGAVVRISARLICRRSRSLPTGAGERQGLRPFVPERQSAARVIRQARCPAQRRRPR